MFRLLLPTNLENDMGKKYRVIRMYKEAGIRQRVIKTGLTLEQAQAHCRDPETSSSTCTRYTGRARTKACGQWFDGYEAVA